MPVEVKSPPKAPKALPIPPDRAVPSIRVVEYLKASTKSCVLPNKGKRTIKPIINKFLFMAYKLINKEI